jgi:hypothetical protein
MGRPIKKKFFGNTNAGTTGQGVGGESVATIVPNNTGTLYTTSTTLAVTFTAPQIPGGEAATGNVTTNALGNVASVTLTDSGSGYTSAPTAVVAGGTTGTTATFVVSLTTSLQNAIAGNAFITGGSAKVFDIIKQEASRRYLVQTADGRGQCKLVTTSTLAAAQMNIVATDVNGSTYYVRKLTARRAVLVQDTVDGSFAFANNSAAGWTLGEASAGVVSIASN